jgi:hypothetical protein
MRMRSVTLLPTAVLLLVGCSRNDSAPPAIEKEVRPPDLTASDAQRALIEFAEHPDGRETAPWERLDDLRMGGAIDLLAPTEEGVYHGGTWTVCLVRKEFYFIVVRGVHTWRLKGKFELRGGKWTAIAVDESRAFHLPKDEREESEPADSGAVADRPRE